MRSYSKVIIDLNGQRTFDLVSRNVSTSGSFSLAGAVREFIENTSAAKQALANSTVAGMCNTSLTRALYKYLKNQDIDAELIVGEGFTKRLINPSVQLQDEIKVNGNASVAEKLQHGVVRVSGIVIDLTHLRLGETYAKVHNFPYREFKEFWIRTKSVSNLVDIRPDEMAARVKHAANQSQMQTMENRRTAQFA
jgi:hypothetical protein